jgi:hypothetical protein
MRRPMLPLALLAALTMLAVASPSFAQTTTTEREGYGYHFDDDHMVGDTLGSPPPILKVPKKGRRIMLIRARTSFVAEMLKSVEVM